ncbi:hypothetical protein [Streptacidiphilus cavernicola]|uniref:Uncharacterized protein n=1 Tax=Streptacidiphilus cavernicola TaxID=3342716 RepID=A0ABV6VVI4_9ACTN
MSDPFDDRSVPHPVPPGAYPLLEAALALLNRDLAATLPEQLPLRLLLQSPWADEPETVCVALADGEWHGNPLDPDQLRDADAALAAIADAAQETVTERLWQAWPVCTEHALGMHPGEADGRLVWCCSGQRLRRGPAHVRAAVGELDTLIRPHRPNRKRRHRS